MAKQSISKVKAKEEYFEKETRYCKIIRSVTIQDEYEVFAIEKIYVKALGRYEIRICLYKDCLDRPNKLIARPADICQEKLINLILLGLKSGVLDEKCKKELIKGLS